MLAGLPKAPSAINPLSNPQAAINRRNYVLSRMQHYGYISDQEYSNAINSADVAKKHETQLELHAPYVTEMVRHALIKRWGEDIYTAGLQIYTTIDSKLQNHANEATRAAVLKYEQRHGYKGAEANWGTPTQNILSKWVQKLKTLEPIADLEPGVVLTVNDMSDPSTAPNYITVLNNQGKIIRIDWDGLVWARKKIKDSHLLGKKPSLASEILTPGDLIKIWYDNNTGKWVLSQIPDIEAALLALNPQNGKIVALTGGYDFSKSNFNRITQAYRQAGSSLKPFIYSAALEKGFTAASIFNDAPIVINDPEQEALWRPQNSNKQFYGPTRLRTALVKSRNLVSIRLLQATGINDTHQFLQRFGFKAEQIPSSLSLALGTASVTPLQLGQGYSTFANGGYAINPILIKKITNGNDQILYQLAEDNNTLAEHSSDFEYYETQNNLTNNKQIIPPQNAYLINSMLMDAIKTGTGQRALTLNRRDIAGKTGTSSDNVDAWFCGFNPNLVTIAWMGFDQPKSIHEYAATTALPLWIDFMSQALKAVPEQYLPMPDGLISARIDPNSGLLADSKQHNSLFELFITGTEPKEISSIEDKIYNFDNNSSKDTNTNMESISAEQIF
jgi:penicillin-binding protein 1A